MQPSFSQLFQAYPSILTGLPKLSLHTPTDLQQQFLTIDAPIHHLILIAPQNSGKTIALLLHALTKFINQQQGILGVVAHSKQLAQKCSHLLGMLSKISVHNLGMSAIGQATGKMIVIGTPKQINNLWKKQKDQMGIIVVPQADLLFSYGYGPDMELLAGSLNSQTVAYKLSCMSVPNDSQLQNFKKEWMKKAIKIDYSPPQQAQVKQAQDDQITHFFQVGDRLTPAISLYITLKFGLVNPKILVLVDNIPDVYRYALFLQRCKMTGVGIYNKQNPIDLRFYVLNVWMHGTTNILIATPDILKDIADNTFKNNLKKISSKRKHLQLYNMTTIISIGVSHLPKPQILFQSFQLKPFIMTFLQHSQHQATALHELINYQKKHFAHSVIKELPITKKQLDGFRYRVSDVWSTLNSHRIQLYQQLDFKKKLLKSPQLREQLQKNQKEREALVKVINDLRKKIDHGQVTLSQFVPQYLVPQCLKVPYQQKMKALQAKMEQQAPIAHQKVKKVLRHVNLQDQNPQTTDVDRLKLISARKRWKLLHGFKLKKRNKRAQKKGVFDS